MSDEENGRAVAEPRGQNPKRELASIANHNDTAAQRWAQGS